VTRVFENYFDARHCAAQLARLVGRDVGIEMASEYGRTVYRVKQLPNPANRYGWELRCEVVAFDDDFDFDADGAK
jgi:hypothetical protein